MHAVLNGVEYGIVGLLVFLLLLVLVLFAVKIWELRKWRADAELWNRRSREAWQSEEALQWWGSAVHPSLGSLLLRAAWENRNLVPDALEKVLQSELSAHKRKIESSVAWIGTIGANAPFVGLAGTVLGILAAFQAMADQAGGGSSELMASISRSLLATAMGLAVAIPAVICYNLLRQKIYALAEEGNDLIRLLLARAIQHGAETWQKSEQERHHWHREQWQKYDSSWES